MWAGVVMLQINYDDKFEGMLMNRKREVLEQYYTEHFDALAKGAARPFDTPQDGEDVVQEAFTRALHYLPQFNPDKGNFEQWIRRILQNTIRDFLKEKRLKGLSNSEPDEMGEFISLDDKLLCNELGHKIAKRKQPARDILKLYYFLGYQPAEIAKALGITVFAVNVAVARFKRSL